MEVTSGSVPSKSRTRLVWAPGGTSGGRNYISEYQFFGYAPAPVGAPDGAPDGTLLKVSSTIRLNAAGTAFTSSETADRCRLRWECSRAGLRDPNGDAAAVADPSDANFSGGETAHREPSLHPEPSAHLERSGSVTVTIPACPQPDPVRLAGAYREHNDLSRGCSLDRQNVSNSTRSASRLDLKQSDTLAGTGVRASRLSGTARTAKKPIFMGFS